MCFEGKSLLGDDDTAWIGACFGDDEEAFIETGLVDDDVTLLGAGLVDDDVTLIGAGLADDDEGLGTGSGNMFSMWEFVSSNSEPLKRRISNATSKKIDAVSKNETLRAYWKYSIWSCQKRCGYRWNGF